LTLGLEFTPTARAIEAAAVFAGRHLPQRAPFSPLLTRVHAGLGRVGDHGLRYAQVVGGVRLACRLDDWLWARMYIWGVWEPETTAFVRAWLRPGDTVLDVGANNGYFTCISAEVVGAGGRVHAFEPSPDAYELLGLSVAANSFADRVVCNQMAVGERDGEVLTLRMHPERFYSGQSSLLPLEKLAGGAEWRVAVTTLDRYAADHGLEAVRMMKMDIEGGELGALEGGSRFLDHVRPDAIVCETQSNELRPDAPEALLQLLAKHGYHAHYIDADGGLRVYDGLPLVERGINLCFLAS